MSEYVRLKMAQYKQPGAPAGGPHFAAGTADAITETNHSDATEHSVPPHIVASVSADLSDGPVPLSQFVARTGLESRATATAAPSAPPAQLRAIQLQKIYRKGQVQIPVLAGVDAASTYCYLLAAAEHRDADTWGVHLLDASGRGLKPEYTIADAGQGLRGGQKAAWGDTPCHGDVFHIQHQYEGLANTLSRLAKGARSRRQRVEDRTNRAGQYGPDAELAIQLDLARQTESQASCLARDIRTLTQWLNHDVLALAGPALATRQMLFDFIVEELVCRGGSVATFARWMLTAGMTIKSHHIRRRSGTVRR